jgi:hypothetical protein
MIDNTLNARELLSTRYRVILNRGGRGEKNVTHNQVLSTARDDLAERVVRDKLPDAQRPLSRVGMPSQEELDKVLEMYKEIERKEFEAEREKQKQIALESGKYEKE